MLVLNIRQVVDDGLWESEFKDHISATSTPDPDFDSSIAAMASIDKEKSRAVSLC